MPLYKKCIPFADNCTDTSFSINLSDMIILIFTVGHTYC